MGLLSNPTWTTDYPGVSWSAVLSYPGPEMGLYVQQPINRWWMVAISTKQMVTRQQKYDFIIAEGVGIEQE